MTSEVLLSGFLAKPEAAVYFIVTFTSSILIVAAFFCYRLLSYLKAITDAVNRLQPPLNEINSRVGKIESDVSQVSSILESIQILKDLIGSVAGISKHIAEAEQRIGVLIPQLIRTSGELSEKLASLKDVAQAMRENEKLVNEKILPETSRTNEILEKIRESLDKNK